MKAGRASSTSLLIARYLLLANATPSLRPLLLENSAALTRQLLDAEGKTLWFEFSLRHALLRRALLAAERFLLPGMGLHWLSRKCLLDAHARDALAAGCRQVVVLGAGLDTLACRLHSACVSFELDHPATQATKRHAFANSPTFVTVDLTRDSVAQSLRGEPRFDSSQPTFFVAEGLLMYLPHDRVAAVFDDAAAMGAPGCRFAFTFMEARPGRPIAFHNSRRIIAWWLRWCGEPFRWALARPEVENFVQQHGWQLSALSTPEELRSRFLAPHGLDSAPLAVGESIGLAHRIAA